MPDDTRTARQIARSKTRREGDRSAALANELMKLPETTLNKLELDEQLREDVDRARAVATHNARRRAERALAGDLRKYDLAEVAEQLAKRQETSGADVKQFHLAEKWRARLIEEGIAVAAEFPGGTDAELERLVEAARREATTGRVRGATRALFRHITERLKAAR